MRWDVGLNKKHLAHFIFARDDASELRLMFGASFCAASRAASLKSLRLCSSQGQQSVVHCLLTGLQAKPECHLGNNSTGRSCACLAD